MKRKTLFLVQAAVIAALYAALTWFSAAFGLAYGAVQLRVSEALTVLCVFTGAAVPGLTAGCLVSNITSSVSPLDMLFGTAASLLAALCARKTRNIRLKGLPVLAQLFPIVFNAVFVAAETVLVFGEAGKLQLFFLTAGTVAAGEAAVCLVLGLPLYAVLNRSRILKKYFDAGSPEPVLRKGNVNEKNNCCR